MLISLLVTILIIGLVIYLIQLIPLPAPFQQIAMAIVVLIAILWLLGNFGVLHGTATCAGRLIC